VQRAPELSHFLPEAYERFASHISLANKPPLSLVYASYLIDPSVFIGTKNSSHFVKLLLNRKRIMTVSQSLVEHELI
jgi:hypothetical protein